MRITDVTIRNANNGFILEWYDDESKTMIYSEMEELFEAVKELLAEG